ncbi:MAG: response regulator [Deltaproteobacteria bacterium]|jgi:two-component system response regulator YesN|nr:response regulator [Deltaproteobacteria bacterium]
MYKVLVADPDPLMRRALASMIKRVENFELSYAVSSGAQAVETCRNATVDLVLLEIMLPDACGLDTAEEIRNINPNIAICIISACREFEFAHRALRMKISEYLPKPVSFAELRHFLLARSKSPSGSVYDDFETFFEIVKDRDLKRAYYELRPVASVIRSLADGDHERLRDILNRIGRRLIDTLDAFEPERTGLADLPPINPSLLSSDQSIELWLFKAMDYVLWQSGLQRHPFLEKVYVFIDNNIQANIGLNEIVTHCSVSQAHLSRIFRKLFKVSVMEYLHLKKLSLAKAYLAMTDHSTSEVAFRLGYNESSYFSKVFKKYEHATVRQYRQQLDGERSSLDAEVGELLAQSGDVK